MSRTETVTYELFVEHGSTDRFLKRLKNEVDYYNNAKQPIVPVNCWTGWNNFEITGEFKDEFLLPRVYPTRMKGWIVEENGGIRICYSFEKVEKFKKWTNFIGVYTGIFFAVSWIGLLGNWSAQIGKAEWGDLLIALLKILLTLGPFTALFTYVIWRGGSITKRHRASMEEFLRAAAWEG